MDVPQPTTASVQPHTYACDIDNTISAFPAFFRVFFPALQAAGCKVGILTGRPASEREANLAMLAQLGITPDFYVGKPDGTTMSDGTYKALACESLGIDVLFDDFEHDDPKMLADFFSQNSTTTCFTSWVLPASH